MNASWVERNPYVFLVPIGSQIKFMTKSSTTVKEEA